jgi:hypothetical protein
MKHPVAIASCVLFLFVGATVLVSRFSTVAHAERTCTIPKEFGSLKAASMSGLMFEAADGTIRILDVGKTSCPVEDVTQRR